MPPAHCPFCCRTWWLLLNRPDASSNVALAPLTDMSLSGSDAACERAYPRARPTKDKQTVTRRKWNGAEGTAQQRVTRRWDFGG